MWAALVPLIVGSALVPVQLIVTILALRSAHGPLTAAAWIAGLSTVRVCQGIVFGLVLGSSSAATGGSDGHTSPFTSGLLIVVGLASLVLAVRSWVRAPDPDAPPPRWLAATAALRPGRAYLLGAGALVIGVRFWVLTLSAIAVITDAELGRAAGIVVFASFAVLAVAPHLAILGFALVAPVASSSMLTASSSWLEARNRVIMIGLGTVLGIWFIAKGLSALGIV